MKENAPFIDATLIQTDLTSDLKGNYQRKTSVLFWLY
jgi:dihydrofolate synthase/folylpolyglutamate synthase